MYISINEISHKENTKRNRDLYRFYIFDIDMRQISCLIFTA